MTGPAIVLLGLLSGGLINYVARLMLRSEDPISQSAPHKECPHKQSIWEIIPFLSFFFDTKNCPHCQHRLFYEYPLVEIFTACTFALLAHHFHNPTYIASMMFFCAILICVCITDLKAKIIPHEITYPAIILGIIFSAQIRSDFIGALAGIGISYIFFDFLAFYGLHIYLWFNTTAALPFQRSLSKEPVPLKNSVQSLWLSKESVQKQVKSGDEVFSRRIFCKGIPIEDIEIIGGGDAVLAALISAWLGYQKLILAIVVSLLVGSVLGALYLLSEIWKQRLMSILVLPVTAGAIVTTCLAILLLIFAANSTQQPFLSMPYLQVALGAILVGSLVGVIIAGAKVSKPFPFGPALAAGAIVAIFTKNTT